MLLESDKIEPKKTGGFKKLFAYYLLIILLPVAFGGGWYFGSKKSALLDGEEAQAKIINLSAPKGLKKKDVDFNLFLEVWNRVKQNYVDQPVDEKKLFYGALSGLVSSLGDPYTVFLEPESAAKFTQELSGSFEGIGAEIGIKQKQLTIIAPLPDSPAEKAGLRAGDKIIAIDGQLTVGMPLDSAVSKIRGKKNTEVALKIIHAQEEPKEVKITRSKIVIHSVVLKWKQGNIAYIRLTNFNEDTFENWQKVAREVSSKNPSGIILDLRNNPGGYLDTAINIASYWVGPNEIVVKEKDSRSQVQNFYSRGAPAFKGIKTAVLVNEGSASGSEIVAGALMDYGAARVIGKKTFGKGSVQDLQRLSDGAALKITVAKWFTPKDRSINEQGIAPDEIVELTEDDFSNDRDPQLDRAIEFFK